MVDIHNRRIDLVAVVLAALVEVAYDHLVAAVDIAGIPDPLVVVDSFAGGIEDGRNVDHLVVDGECIPVVVPQVWAERKFV